MKKRMLWVSASLLLAIGLGWAVWSEVDRAWTAAIAAGNAYR